jgi:hypothetical protein
VEAHSLTNTEPVPSNEGAKERIYPMAKLPQIRDVGTLGVITDIRPASLPLHAFSRGKNVRFDEGKVSRAPVFRKLKDSLGFNPRFTYGIPGEYGGGFASIIMVSDTYQLKSYQNGTVTSVQGSLSLTSSNNNTVTGTNLADITYLNRADKVPVYMAPSGSNFAALPNWDSNWRAEAVRSYGDFLLALNLTESGTTYPTRVRYSNLALANSVPDSWDATDTTKSAGFNDLVQMQSGIVDGATLGTNFIIYSKDQVWLMEFVGGTFIHNFRKLFSECGVVNQNCILEVDGTHYVFDHDDIYVHDSHTRQSICDERVKEYIFGGLNTAKTDRCFAHHNPDLDEVMFCYVSGDDMAEYTNGSRCNRAAVFNYKKQTWSFMDLPNVSSSTVGTVRSSVNYNLATLSYESSGGTYYTQEAGYDIHSLFVGEANSVDGITSAKLYGLDLSDSGSLAFPLDTEANKSPYIERQGIDLDEMSSLNGYKVIKMILPQVDTTNVNKQFSFTFGSSDLLGAAPVYDSSINFDGATDYKIDTRVSGRYLSYKMTLADNKDFSFLGFDLDVLTTGRR